VPEESLSEKENERMYAGGKLEGGERNNVHGKKPRERGRIQECM
jgi:hypothetical protein